ncbi:LysR substrate-binding domain-containing protein [Curvibacter sp. APW13]|uniref:LysR substrate-binding domain-containing protein n=1 Tax=Curvibacter sp. APW13 TaxID=3077236 RepID=UPI0028DFC0F3|nr:LysR substrate-binding domain-containing protein [Curvibacter sp. APW13]MDT8992393.1 LysR substrate-binding domain-containing protein [Curvibacter sp. APW13]
MRNVEMRHLRYFVAVAEAGSVVAGARAVGIVQPALSRQIRELEAAIGTPLLIRQAKGVALTAAGASFLHDARQLLAELQASRQRALRAGAGELGELRLGVLPNYLGLPVFAKTLHAFRKACPDVRVCVEPMLSAAQVAAIANLQLDGGVMAWRQEAAAHLSGVLLQRERFVLAVPASEHRVPKTLSDLAHWPFIWLDPIRSAAHHRFLMAQCAQAGFTPQITQTGSDIPTLAGLVGAGMGCAFVPESLSATCPPTVRLVRLEEVAQTFDVEFAYDSATVSPVLMRFLSVLRQQL